MQSNFCVPKFSSLSIKDKIVSAFFLPWTKSVLLHARKAGDKTGFLDFCCGAGKNEDGSEAAPILVLKKAVEHSEVGSMLVPVFYDKEPKNVLKLRQSVSNIPDISSLGHEPQIEKGATYEELAGGMQKISDLPSLAVVDPLGVKDLSLHALCATIRDWKFDCIFLLHYNQLEKIIENPFKAKQLDTVFGKAAADRLRAVSDRLNARQKESFVVRAFLDCFKGVRVFHSVVLRYGKGKGDIHFLIYLTKSVTRHRLMKELMAGNGYTKADTVHAKQGQAEGSGVSFQAGLFTGDQF